MLEDDFDEVICMAKFAKVPRDSSHPVANQPIQQTEEPLAAVEKLSQAYTIHTY